MSSRVLALATTPSLLQAALMAADAQRDVDEFAATHVAAQRLGESSIVELSVTDDDPIAAATDRVRAGHPGRAVHERRRPSRLPGHAGQAGRTRSQTATAQRDKLVSQLRGIADVTARADLGAQIQSANQLLSQLSSPARHRWRSTTRTGTSVVLVGNKPDIRQVQSSILPQLALAVLLGLVLGLTAATILETMRPRVNSIRALARMLQAPVLGKSTEDIGVPAQHDGARRPPARRRRGRADGRRRHRRRHRRPHCCSHSRAIPPLRTAKRRVRRTPRPVSMRTDDLFELDECGLAHRSPTSASPGCRRSLRRTR